MMIPLIESVINGICIISHDQINLKIYFGINTIEWFQK